MAYLWKTWASSRTWFANSSLSRSPRVLEYLSIDRGGSATEMGQGSRHSNCFRATVSTSVVVGTELKKGQHRGGGSTACFLSCALARWKRLCAYALAFYGLHWIYRFKRAVRRSLDATRVGRRSIGGYLSFSRVSAALRCQGVRKGTLLSLKSGMHGLAGFGREIGSLPPCLA